MSKQDFLDEIIQEMESEGKQAEQISKIEYHTEMENVVRHEVKVPGSSAGAHLPTSSERHTPGCLAKAEIKEMEEIDKKYFEKNMEEHER